MRESNDRFFYSRSDLEMKSKEEVSDIAVSYVHEWERIQLSEARKQLLSTVVKIRSSSISKVGIQGVRLSKRIEHMFVAFRENRNPWPVDETLQVFDGLVGRLILKRMTVLMIGVFAILPAVVSLVLLAKQNSDMIEQNRVEEAADYDLNRSQLLDILFNTYTQKVSDSKIQTLPMSHRRIRAEAFGTLIALEKQRWDRSEIEAIPPTKYVDIRKCNLSNTVLGGRLGLLDGKSRRDFTRVSLETSDLRKTHFIESKLTASVFRDSRAEGMVVSSPDASYADFSRIQAEGSRFEFDGKTATPLNLEGAIFDGADLKNALFYQVMMIKCGLNKADLKGVVFDSSLIFETDFSGAILSKETLFVSTSIHKCLFTENQLSTIQIPEFCFVEETADPHVKRVMVDQDKYMDWQNQYSNEMKELADEELVELEAAQQIREERE